MARGWYGTPKTWQEAARRTGALLAMGEPRAALASRGLARRLWHTAQGAGSLPY
jgi:hypothetical protein